jgi:ribosomal protein S18 acetylase RimI-like enzyme
MHIVRTMDINDYTQIFELWNKTEGVGLRSLDDSEAGIQKFLKRNPSTCFVAELNNEIIGIIMAGNDGRRGYIYHTTVKEDYRNKGIGKELITAVENSLQEEGINKIALVVFKKNEKGNKFWERNGYTEREDLNYRNRSINTKNV